MRTCPLKEFQVPEFLAGATTLRVPVRPQPKPCHFWGSSEANWTCEFYQYPLPSRSVAKVLVDNCPYPVGSELALTETWAMGWVDPFMPATVFYKADNCLAGMQWRRAITMPAKFSRFKRRVTAVKVEYREIWEWVLTLEEL